LQRACSLEPSFFQVIRNFKNDAVKEFTRCRWSLQPSNYESGVRSSNLFGRASPNKTANTYVIEIAL
ncbi:MAG: hypothetical protein WAK34_15355, partial [Rhodoplanes sp.]